MRRIIKRLFSLTLLVPAAAAASPVAQEGMASEIVRDSVEILFPQSKWTVDRKYGENPASLESLARIVEMLREDSTLTLREIVFSGSSSPEGRVAFNEWLSEQRAKALFNQVAGSGVADGVPQSSRFLGNDWERLLGLVRGDGSVPYRDEVITLLEEIVREKAALGKEPPRSLLRVKRLRGGVPYYYMYRNLFPAVRAARLVFYYDRPAAHAPLAEAVAPDAGEADQAAEAVAEEPADTTAFVTPAVEVAQAAKPFYMDVRTNMLYDLLALPNIGVEFYLGKNITIGANWLYGWWSKRIKDHWWRAYGGEVNARWWFGSKAAAKPLTGHHAGIYAQLYTYDFEWGGTGEMGGRPGGNLWDKNLWAAGIEYGYSLPVMRHFNIDFTIGIGYTTGLYHKYKPSGDSYVWESTHRRHFFGPTKVEVALVWLLGRGNVNAGKGGER